MLVRLSIQRGIGRGLCLALFSLVILNAARLAAATEAESDGARVYQQCAGCHGSDLDGGAFGPPLKGAAFVKKWSGKSVQLLDFISSAMPPSAPGSLTSSQYHAVADFLASTSGGLAAPATTAAPASSKAVDDLLSGHVGPQPSAPAVFGDSRYREALAKRSERLKSLTPVTVAMLRSPPPGDWLAWRRTQDEQGSSPLTQINRRNVLSLTLKWGWALPAGSNEIAPLVHDGILFLNSANEVQAIDAANGTLLWRYRREIPEQFRGPVNGVQRNIAILGTSIYLSTADRHVVALDATTGQVVWDTEIVPAGSPGMILSAGPTLAGKVLIQGVSLGAACRGGCFVVGLDASSGKKIWRFNTVAQRGEQGEGSWNGTPVDQRSGSAVYVAGSYDPDLDLYYFGTAGTYGISRLLEKRKDAGSSNNDALYTDSTIALRPDSGALVWYHQHFPREVWDLDEAFERILVNLPEQNGIRRLVLSTGKVGILDALDRSDGTYLFSKDFGLNNLVVAIDPKTGRRTIDPARVPRPNQPVDICPSAEGVRNWMAASYNPTTRIIFLAMQETCMTLTWHKTGSRTENDGLLDIGWTLKQPPGGDGQYGRLEAVDLRTRKSVWAKRSRTLPMSSLLATEGGLLFSGDSDRWFRALDDRTGKVLWETRLDGIPNATPISFAVDGKQFIAIVAGGGGAHVADSREITPEVQLGSPASTLYVFSLTSPSKP